MTDASCLTTIDPDELRRLVQTHGKVTVVRSDGTTQRAMLPSSGTGSDPSSSAKDQVALEPLSLTLAGPGLPAEVHGVMDLVDQGHAVVVERSGLPPLVISLFGQGSRIQGAAQAERPGLSSKWVV